MLNEIVFIFFACCENNNNNTDDDDDDDNCNNIGKKNIIYGIMYLFFVRCGREC